MKPSARSWLGALALVALTALAYYPSVRGGFIWDDEAYVIENPNLRDAEGLGRIWLEPRSSPQYYPLVFTSLWLNYQAHGLHPLGYHLVNVLLHAAGALLLWRILASLALPGAWIAAALFAVHPVHVESVAWITERKNVLSGLFYLASARVYLRWAGLTAGRPRQPAEYVLSLVLFAAALLSKSVTATLPAALLLVVWWKNGRLRAADAGPLLPFVALGVAAGLHTVWLERAHVGAEGAEWSLTFLDRLLIAARALVFYAQKLAWPRPLVFMYPRWEPDAALWWFLFPAFLALTLVVLWRQREAWGRGPLVAVLFFAGTLLPALGFFNIYPMRYTFVADHYQYLASVGLLALAGAAIARLGGGAATGVAAALVLSLAALTWNRGFVFRNAETVWVDTLRHNPGSWMAHNNLGLLQAARGRWTDAMRSYRAALDLRPASPETLTNLGMALLAQGRTRDAIEQHRRAVEIDPSYANGWNNLGITQAQAGDPDGGLTSLRRAISLQPHFPDAYMNLGHAYLAGGRMGEAIASYRKALAQRPRWPEAANNLAWLLATAPDPALRNTSQAVDLAEWACTMTQYRDANMLDTLAAAYAAAQRFPQAALIAEKAVAAARGAGNADHAARIAKRLEGYRAGRAAAP